MIRRFILLLTLAVFCFLGKAQNELIVEQLVSGNMEQIREGKPINEQLNIICKGSNFEVVEKTCLPYFLDTVPSIRIQAIRYLAITSLKSSDIENKKKSIDYLLQNCFDENSGVVNAAYNYVKQFEIEDFNDKAMNLLDSLILYGKYYRPDSYKIAACHNKNTVKILLKNKLSTVTSKPEIWQLNLALCRIGDNQAKNYVLSVLKHVNINSEFIYNVVPDLIYTRQSDIYNFLFNIIKDPSYKCVSSNPDDEKLINCGYYLVELLAGEIDKFPLSVNDFGELKEPLTEKSLQEVRDWYHSHPEFKIITNKY